MAKRTPMMEQYLQVKETCQDALLFFRLGDFYELFYEDAELASQLLDLTLTGRGTGDNRMPMCGVPFHSADGYIGRLVGAGYKVAICEQVEDPKAAKGLVRRDIVRIVTPGTGYEFIRDGDVRLLIATATEAGEKGLFRAAVMDPMTGDLWWREGDRDLILSWFTSQRITEVVVAKQGSEQLVDLLAQFAARSKATLSSFAVLPKEGKLLSPHEILIHYLEYTGKRELVHIKAPTFVETDAYLQLTSSAIANLELLSPLFPGRKGATLFDAMDHTETAMGRRKLREMIERPFAKIAPIIERQDAIAMFLEDSGLLFELLSRLKGLHDVARLASRVSFGSATPRDLVLLSAALMRALHMKEELQKRTLQGSLIGICGRIHDLGGLAGSIAATLVEDPPGNGKDGGILRPMVDETVDRLRAISQGGRSHLAALEQAERVRTGIKSLKISYNRVFGYYIEVTSANAHLVPADYERKQTLANAERFVTPELRRREQEILEADDRLKALEWEHFENLLHQTLEVLAAIQETADALGELDALMSLATMAQNHRYVRPVVDHSAEIEILRGRHPVVEQFVGGDYVPNDTHLHPNRFIGVITGPNMAGKSTYMRQVALIVLMAQMGAYVPADAVRIGIVDKLFTRIGASDDVSGGMSTFMVEMTEAAEILQNATAQSLIILDEIGRGTATYDGMSIAEAIVEHIHDKTLARTLFATHYHELTALPTRLSQVFNLSVAVAEHGEQLVFLHQIVDRPADRSYGIQVAQRAGLPPTVTARARDILSLLEQGVHECLPLTTGVSFPAMDPVFFPLQVMEQVAITLADDDEKGGPLEDEAMALLDEIAGLDVDDLTPRAALALLYELRNRCATWKVAKTEGVGAHG